jgi:HD superfamily phosphohydrolase
MGNFPLLEKPIPDLCADRVDYFFRDSVLLGVCKQDDIGLFLNHLVVREGDILVDNAAIAKNIALGYMECSKKLWASPTQAASFQILADALKSGLAAGIISEKDFLLTDQQLYGKLRSSKNMEVTSKLDILNPGFFATDSPQDFDFYVRTKARYIDPKVIQGTAVKRLSELDKDYKKQMLDFIEKVSAGYYVKIFPRLKTLGSRPSKAEFPESGSRSEKGKAGLFGSLPEFKSKR